MAQDFLPTLNQKTVIIMDNAAFHRKKPLQEMVQKYGHIIVFMPTYSPDLNPIEHKWAQAKNIRRTSQCSIDELFTQFQI